VATFLFGTSGGLYRSDGSLLDHRPVTHLAAGAAGPWGVLEDRDMATWDGERWMPVASLTDHRPRCVLPLDDGALAGAADARLYRVDARLAGSVASFDAVPTRADWYTPWGGPPDTRSLSRGPAGTYANVHVGGILRSDDDERWSPTAIDIDADVHQVLVDGDRVLAATAFGLAESPDRGATWAFHADGLHATYCRAVAVAGDAVLVSASRGHAGADAALYRWAGGAFERAREGLPAWFDDNIDTHCLAAEGTLAAAGTRDGRLFVSEDGGWSWTEAASGLPAVRAVCLARLAG
jgi:hypothetical protein